MGEDANRPVGLALVAAGVAGGLAALSIGGWTGGEWGPRTVPLLAAATLALAGVAIAASPAARPPRAAGEARVVLLLALAVLYVLGIDRIGYLLATGLAAPAAFALFGVRKPLRLVATAVAVPLALHLAFFRLLGVFPPLGSWFDLLDWVPL
ncbi:tripartite tricarboxylate transporter TctB family protein [Jannaschia sp. Os4]|uniref:tripartite tricarboxylate transporter TctB family protein n=1 Tax=Jannaschia sp. Os4 TaxID=2807617 RepID=UPI00193AD8C0|nr:tripartite tricarboxylate transporter TctB family protein [Jannaschia sp. Os4]MBM2576283.1 tripartite tricarboxylate transporter TctB family protein [Jannaschia sp. Os4]